MPLTPRQLEILILYARGLRRPEIAKAMHIGYRTIDRQLEEIRGRLETRTIAHSLIVAIARGQLVLDAESESVSTPDPVELVAL